MKNDKTSKLPLFLNSGSIDLTAAIVAQIKALPESPSGATLRFGFMTGIGHVMNVAPMSAESAVYLEAKTDKATGKVYKAKPYSVRGYVFEAK